MIAAINGLVLQTRRLKTITGPASLDLQRSAGPIRGRFLPALHCDGEFLSWGIEELASSVLLCAVETWNCRSSSRATVRFRDVDNPQLHALLGFGFSGCGLNRRGSRIHWSGCRISGDREDSIHHLPGAVSGLAGDTPREGTGLEVVAKTLV